MERRKFTREFKLEAVRLITERGVSYAHKPLVWSLFRAHPGSLDS